MISESPLTTIYYRKTVPEITARNILSKVQIEELLTRAKDYSPGYLYPIVKIFVETAAKPNEIVDLTWKQDHGRPKIRAAFFLAFLKF